MTAKELCLMSSPIQLCIFDNIEVVEFSACCCVCVEIAADSLGV